MVHTSVLSVGLHGAHTDSFDLKQLAFIVGTVKINIECVLLLVLRFIAKKLCTACSRTNNKIVPLTNLNKYLYNDKSGIKVNINNTSEKV